MIRVTRTSHLGEILRRLRRDRGMSPEGLAHRARISRSGVHKRETSGSATVGMLLDHLDVLGYDLALIPREQA